MLWNRQYHIPASTALTLLSSVSESLRNSKRSREEAINSARTRCSEEGFQPAKLPRIQLE